MTCLNLFIIPIVLEILILIQSICFFQFKFLLIFKPRNKKLSTTSILLLSILSSGISTVFCGCRNTIHLDFFTFIDNLFSFSHNDSFFNSRFIIVWSYTSKSTINVVSSANRIQNNISLHLVKSFTYIRNRSGPGIDPCRTLSRLSRRQNRTLVRQILTSKDGPRT